MQEQCIHEEFMRLICCMMGYCKFFRENRYGKEMPQNKIMHNAVKYSVDERQLGKELAMH
jgi:hypothetical protein